MPPAASPASTPASLADLDVATLVARTTSGGTSSLEVVEACLSRIAERDPGLNAFSLVLADEARAEAGARDAACEAGEELGPLHGVPVAIKEELDVEGCVTTFGGAANTTPAAADSEVVRRLRAAGAVVIGKTRMPEFGQWPFTESVAGSITRNPWDTSRTPGGSSGGTAVAVAAGMVPIGIGGDGGGSIRIPSACCGLYGLKPQRGRVTTAPHDQLWWALGTTGPLARTVLDSALVYDVIRGNEPTDRFTAREPVGSFADAARAEPRPLRIGWSTKAVTRGITPHPEHVQAVRETAALLERRGHDVREVDPRYPDPTGAFVPQFFAGIRDEAALVERPARLEPRTKEILRLGSWVRPAVVRWALRAGERVATKADRVFEDVDVLITPAMANRPRPVGALSRGGAVTVAARSMPMIAWTALWNVTGHPAASVPAGTGTDGLPLAVQLVGRRHDETTLLTLSAELERARPWSMPDLGPGPLAGA